MPKQNRLFDLFRLELDAFDLCPKAFKVIAMEHLHLLPRAAQGAHDMLMPSSDGI